MLNLVRIECPICGNDVSGSDTNELSQGLKMHLADAHNMSNISRGQEEKQSRGSTYGVASSYAESGRAHLSSGAPRVEEPSRPGGRERTGGRMMGGAREKESGMGERAEEKSRDVGSSMGMSGGKENIEVNCPMCGRSIRGAGDDDLSDNLSGHMKEAHDIKPKLSARMGMS